MTAPGGDRPVEHIVVKVSPDLTGFRRKTQTDLKAAMSGVASVKVKVVPDLTGFRAALRTHLRGIDIGYKVKVEADAKGLSTSIATAVRRAQILLNSETFKINVKVDEAGLNNGLNRAQRRFRTNQEQMDHLHRQAIEQQERDTTRIAEKGERNRQRRLNSIRKTITADRWGPQLISTGGAGIQPMNALYGVVAAMTPALFAMAGSAVQASTSVAALGAAGIGAATGLSAIFGAFTNVLAALKQADTTRSQSIRKTTNDAATQRANARQIASAERGIGDAQREVTRRQADLNAVRKQAVQDLKDLRREVHNLATEESGAQLDVKAAKQAQLDIESNFFASHLERLQAAQATKEAEDKLNDTHAKRIEQTKKLSDQEKAGGVKADPQVIAAQQALGDATRNLTEARQQLTDVTVAQADASNKASMADSKLADRLARMSKAGRAMFEYLNGPATDAVWAFQRRMESATLPGFLSFLKDAGLTSKSNKTAFGIMGTSAEHMGHIMSRTAKEAGKITKTSWFRSDLKKINKENEKSFGLLSKAALTLVKPLMQILAAAAPLETRFSKWVLTLTTKFAGFIDKQSKNGGLSKWFTDAGIAMRRWIGLGTSIVKMLAPIFMTSLPAGGSLVQRLTTFVDKLGAWTNSTEGQKWFTNMFTTIGNLHYGDIVKFLLQVSGTIAAFKGVRMGLNHPFLAVLTVIGAMDPGLVATAMNSITAFAIDALGYVNDHKEAAGTLLAIMAGVKGLGAVGRVLDIGLKLPGVDKLREALTSKFTFLDKFLGGASTSVMNVKAGVVNVSGAAGVGAAGGAAEVVGVGLLATVAVAATAALAAAVLVHPLFVAATEKNAERRKKQEESGLPNGFDAPKNEKEAFDNLNRAGENAKSSFLGSLFGGLGEYGQSKVGLDNNKVLQDYITRRKEAVAVEYKKIASTKGVAAAEKYASEQGQLSATTLETLLEKYGTSDKAAKDYATSVFTTSGAIVDATGKAKVLAGQVGDLNTALNKATGKKTISLTMADGSKLVFDNLQTALTYQTALQRGLSLPAAAQRLKLEAEGTKSGGYVHAATGGLIPGFSPHSKADNIPALLTAREYVQPVDVVDHYGVGFMDALRRKEIPRFADGGQAMWPFPTDISKTKIPDVMAGGDGLGGHLVGSAELAAIGEATARAMKATDKQLIALIETGIVESTMRNLSGGDQDSLGWLQQRPSQGWGTKKQIMNPAYATRKFIEKAKRLDKPEYDAGQLAQAVQVSKYPLKYGLEYANAIAILNSVAPYVAGGGGALGGQVGGRGWQWQLAALAKDGFNFHPNSHQTTGGGHAPGSWHYKGRAVDLSPPTMAAFNDIKSHWGATTKELIYGPAGIGIRNGKPYDWGSENPKHMTHIHWAYGDGGLVKARRYDNGGALPPGVTLAVNNTGRTENVQTAAQAGAATRLDRRDLAHLAGLIATAVSGQQITMDGRKVAEVTNRYTYLPAGV